MEFIVPQVMATERAIHPLIKWGGGDRYNFSRSFTVGPILKAEKEASKM